MRPDAHRQVATAPRVAQRAATPVAGSPADPGSISSLAALADAVAAFAHPLARRDLAAQLLTGNPATGVMIICDQPEPDGAPAATLRTRMLAAIGLDAGNCALLHRIPWPTTGGRAPRADELAAFAPFVSRALELAPPRAILALGQLAAGLAGDAMALASARGRWHDVGIGDRQVPLLASLHPRYLLAQPARKREAWADLQDFAERLATPR